MCLVLKFKISLCIFLHDNIILLLLLLLYYIIQFFFFFLFLKCKIFSLFSKFYHIKNICFSSHHILLYCYRYNCIVNNLTTTKTILYIIRPTKYFPRLYKSSSKIPLTKKKIRNQYTFVFDYKCLYRSL